MKNSERDPEGLSIRELRDEDVPGAKALIRSVWREHFGSDPDPFVRNLLDSHDALRDVDQHHRVYAIPDGAFVIAQAGSEVVGTGGFARVDDRAAELRRLFVAPEHRRRGAATMIVDELCAIAGDLQLELIRVSFGSRLLAARAFFLSRGFEEGGTEDDLVRMKKPLAG